MTRHAVAFLALAPVYLALAATVTVTVPSATDIELETIPTEVDLGPDYYEDPDYYQQEFGTVSLGTYRETPCVELSPPLTIGPFGSPSLSSHRPAQVVEVLTTTVKTPTTSTIYSETVRPFCLSEFLLRELTKNLLQVSTSTPPARTVTVNETPASSTVYETSWTTTQPPTSTVTAFVSAATGALEPPLVLSASSCFGSPSF